MKHFQQPKLQNFPRSLQLNEAFFMYRSPAGTIHTNIRQYCNPKDRCTAGCFNINSLLFMTEPGSVLHAATIELTHPEQVAAANPTFKAVPYRWVIFTLYSLLSISIGMGTVVLAPISTKLMAVYDVTDFTLNAIAMAYLLMFAVIGIPANYFIDDHGLRVGMVIGCCFQSVGSALQMCINVNFYIALVGFVLVGVAQPFILNCIAKVATYWFEKERRTMICSILTLLNLVGTGVGFIIPTMFVGQDLSIDDARTQAFNLMMVQAIPTFVLTLLVLILMKDKPEIPPSLGGSTQKMLFKDSVKILVKNRNFLLIFFGFTFYYGPLATLSSLLNFLFRPFNFTDIQIAILGACVIASGFIGVIAVSLYIARSSNFSIVLKVLAGLSIVLLTLGLIGLKFGFPFWVFVLIFCLLGILVTPLYAVSYDMGCQTSFPVGEAQVTGVLNAGGNICALILILIIQTVIGFGTVDTSITAFIVLLVIAITGTLCFMFVKNILLRKEAETKSLAQSDQQSGSLGSGLQTSIDGPPQAIKPEGGAQQTNLTL